MIRMKNEMIAELDIKKLWLSYSKPYVAATTARPLSAVDQNPQPGPSPEWITLAIRHSLRNWSMETWDDVANLR